MNKKIKLESTTSTTIIEHLFWKIWKNKIIKNIIISYLPTYDSNESIPFHIFKYDEIYSVEWLILNNYIDLLKDKVKRKEYLTFNYGLEDNGSNIINYKIETETITTTTTTSKLIKEERSTFKKTIFNIINNENDKDDLNFYFNLFTNYKYLFLNSYSNTLSILLKYDCLTGLIVLKELHQNLSTSTTSTFMNNENKSFKIFGDKELFLNSIKLKSFKISNYLFKNSNYLNLSEKELWNSILKDSNINVIEKIEFIINNIIPFFNNNNKSKKKSKKKSTSNNTTIFQIDKLNFNFSIFEINLNQLLICCYCICHLKSNLQNYLKSLQTKLFKDQYFNIIKSVLPFEENESIDKFILSKDQLNLIKFIKFDPNLSIKKLKFEESEEIDNVKILLKMIIPFMSDHYFDDSINHFICKFTQIDNSDKLRKLLIPRISSVKYYLEYGIYNKDCYDSFLCDYQYLFNNQYNSNKRYTFLKSFLKSLSIYEPNRIKIINKLITTCCSDDKETTIDFINTIYNYKSDNLQEITFKQYSLLPSICKWMPEFFKDIIDNVANSELDFDFLYKNGSTDQVFNHYFNITINKKMNNNNNKVCEINNQDDQQQQQQQVVNYQFLKDLINQNENDDNLDNFKILNGLKRNGIDFIYEILKMNQVNEQDTARFLNTRYTIQKLNQDIYFLYWFSIYYPTSRLNVINDLISFELFWISIGKRSSLTNFLRISKLIQVLNIKSDYVQSPIRLILETASLFGNLELIKYLYKNHFEISFVNHDFSIKLLMNSLNNGHWEVSKLFSSILKSKPLYEENENNIFLPK